MKRCVWQQGFLIAFLVFFIALLYFSKIAVHVTRYQCEDGSITNNPTFCKGYAQLLEKNAKKSNATIPEKKIGMQTKMQIQEAGAGAQAMLPAKGDSASQERMQRNEQSNKQQKEQSSEQPNNQDTASSHPDDLSFDITVTHPIAAQDDESHTATTEKGILVGRVSSSVNAKYDPSVSDGGVAWVEYVEGDANIYYKGLVSGTMIAVANSKDTEYSPILSHGKIAYIKSLMQHSNTANEIDLYDLKQNRTLRLVCTGSFKTLVDFKDHLLIYKENMVEKNKVIDTQSRGGWNCRQPKQVLLPKEENPVRIIASNLLRVENARGVYPCRILHLLNMSIVNMTYPCKSYDDTSAANETGYFLWGSPTVFHEIAATQWILSYTGYSSPTRNFVRVSNGKMVLQLPDIEVNKLQYTRPGFDLVTYDPTTGEITGITRTMKTKESTLAGLLFARDFDVDGNIVAWVDIRRDRTKPDIYVAEIS